MSVRTMAKVWDRSQHAGSELLMLLAIADFADDDGKAYPAVSTLATKCRMTGRNANLILAALRRSGELIVRQNEGPKGTNLYQIAHAPTPEAGFTPEERFTLKLTSPTPEAGFLKPLKPASDEPSVNHQEPPTHVDSKAVLACPANKIIDLYHDCMPLNPKVKVLNKARKSAIAARWREAAEMTCAPFLDGYSSKEDGLRAWRTFFEICAESRFLTGRAASAPGKPPFIATIDFLMSPSGFVKCLENKYHRDIS